MSTETEDKVEQAAVKWDGVTELADGESIETSGSDIPVDETGLPA